MHKKWLLLVLLLFVLVGCVPSETEAPDQTETPVETPVETPIDTITDDLTITYLRSLTVVDRADEFVFPSLELKLYEDSRYQDIHYVDLQEFMGMMFFGLSPFIIQKDTSFIITVPVYADDGTTLQNSYQLSIDPFTDVLEYNDFNFGFAITGEGKTPYVTDLNLISYEKSGPSSSLSIDLKPYGIDLLYAQGVFYIPFDLANLILTGYQLSLYRHMNSVYIFDDAYNLEDFFRNQLLTLPTTDAIMVDTSFRYASLLFDYFYGLKSHHQVNSYLETFTSKKFNEAQTISTFAGNFTQFVFDSDDIHTYVMDYGYKKTQVSQLVSPRPYSKGDIWMNSAFRHCMQAQGDFKMIEYDDAYLLQINQFNLNTKDKLASAFSNIKPSKDIYIDVSCNIGGNVIAAIELLTYMTNDPIDVNYINATTQTRYRETYQSQTPRALTNRFYVVTTYVTFSAANIFTSIVQDMDLAMVIGHKTVGGSAAVGIAVLPNNLVMSYSTPMVFVNKEGDIIEDGISPDVLMDSYMNASQFIAQSRSFFNSKAAYNLDDFSSMAEASVMVKTLFVPSGMVMEGFTVEVYDVISQLKLKSYHTDSDTFTYEEDIPGIRKLLEVRIIAHYTYMGRSFDEIIYQNFIDELKDTMDPSTLTLEIGELYETTKHRDDDVDYIRLVIEEADVYRIQMNGATSGGFASQIYTEGGILVPGSWYHTLTPGVYYLWVNLSQMGFNYSIKVDRMYDDNIGGTNLIVHEGTQSVTLKIDFLKDKEWIVFTMTEEMRLTISVDKYVGTSFFITDEAGVQFHPNSAYLNAPITVILPQGTYQMKFHGDTIGTFVFQFVASLVPGDLSGDHTLSDARFGVLTEGTLSLLFEDKWDRDIYVIETTDITDMVFSGPNEVQVCLILESENHCQYHGQSFILPEGTHYFMFVNLRNLNPFPATLQVKILKDLSDENTMIPIVLDVPFDVIIEKDGDIDYYTLSVPVLATYKLSMVNGHRSKIEVYDANGNRLYWAYYGTLYFQLIPGEYVIRISENVFNLSTVETFTTTVSIYQTNDPDPNLPGWNPPYYRTFLNGASMMNPITGTIAYDNDQDYFIIEITNPGIYQFTTYNDSIFFYYLIDSEGKQTRLRGSDLVEVASGTYYIKVSSSYTSITTPLEYTFGFSKKNTQ